jgi:hypothetical protein
MGVLRSIEHRIESVVEGLFGRAFRAHVQPVEIARKLAKEMDDHRTVSLSRIYVPNEYVVYLAPDDRRQFAEYEANLVAELGDYLAEHARREGYSLLSGPRVTMAEDADLSVGEFGIATRIVQPPSAQPAPQADGAAAAPSAAPEPVSVPAPEPSEPTRVYAPPATPVAPVVVHPAGRFTLNAPVVVVGRADECDLVLADPNVSRRHAELSRDGDVWVLSDLGSTNGVEVNGVRVRRARLTNGDRIVMGKTELRFELPG